LPVGEDAQPLEPNQPAPTEPLATARATAEASGTPITEAGAAPAPEGGAQASAVPEGFAAATMAELSKVVWPSRQQLFSESVAVILMVSASAAAIAAIDRFYHWSAGQVFR
jgi:preprotein translocase subunit SecE